MNEYEYFSEKINWTGFFPFPRSLFQDSPEHTTGPWARLPFAAKSILPAILCFVNESGTCYPSIKQISAFAGTCPNTTRAGIEGLKVLPFFTVKKHLTARGKMQNYYHFRLPDFSMKKQAFPFHRAIIQGGNWSQLSPSAQALYPVMRHFGFYDPASELLEYDGSGFVEREYDVCEADLCVLAECAGIGGRTVREALICLEENHLIQSVDEYRKTFFVYLRPLATYPPEALNHKAVKRLGRKQNAVSTGRF